MTQQLHFSGIKQNIFYKREGGLGADHYRGVVPEDSI